MKNSILNSLEEAQQAVSQLKEPHAVGFIERVAKEIYHCFVRGGKLLVAGNGGSLSDATHFAEEFSGFFRHKRRAFPAIALSDAAHMSCVANDVGFEFVFSRMVEALGKEEDLLFLLSTSGNSKNLIEAAKSAKERGIKVVSFLGKGGGELKLTSDDHLLIDGFAYSDRIQEAHMCAIHIIIEMVEKMWESSMQMAESI